MRILPWAAGAFLGVLLTVSLSSGAVVAGALGSGHEIRAAEFGSPTLSPELRQHILHHAAVVGSGQKGRRLEPLLLSDWALGVRSQLFAGALLHLI